MQVHRQNFLTWKPDIKNEKSVVITVAGCIFAAQKTSVTFVLNGSFDTDTQRWNSLIKKEALHGGVTSKEAQFVVERGR